MFVVLLRQLSRIFLLAVPMVVARGAETSPDPLEAVQGAASEWVKTRTETARLEAEWRSNRVLLESTVTGLTERATELEEKRDNVKATTAKDREEIIAMQAKNQSAADDLQATEARLTALDARLIALRPKLPPRLSDALEMAFRSLAESKLGPGERMQVTMTILNRCAEFNRAVNSDQEILAIDGEPGAKSLEVIYWGLSHGYALERGTGKAWFGSPGPQGWRWEARTDAASMVMRLIAIFNGKADPDFVITPVRLAHATIEPAPR